MQLGGIYFPTDGLLTAPKDHLLVRMPGESLQLNFSCKSDDLSRVPNDRFRRTTALLEVFISWISSCPPGCSLGLRRTT